MPGPCNERCKDCYWWAIDDVLPGVDEDCECRCGPPKIRDNDTLGVWPETDSDDWCKEFKPRFETKENTLEWARGLIRQAEVKDATGGLKT